METKYTEKINKYFSIISAVVLAGFAIIILCKIYSNETNHAYNWDCPLYWTVGRGMLEGIKPYSGFYENKPLGVFLISALSFAWTDDIIICNLFSCLCFFIIAITPALCIVCYCRQKGLLQNKPKALLYISLASVLGILLMRYCEINSGAFQSEALGSAFIGLYFWAIMHIHWEKDKKCNKRQLIFWIILAGFFVMCGVMFKEPFVLISVSCSLIMVKSVRDFIAKTVIPTFIAGVMTLIALLACGSLGDYFTIYLKNMFGKHISLYGSPFERMLHINKLSADLSKLDIFLTFVIIAFLIIFLLNIALNKAYSYKIRLWKAFAFILALFCASFSVGMGGQYYNHHYIFAAPFYMILIISVCEIIIDSLNKKNYHAIHIPNVFKINYNSIIILNLILILILGYCSKRPNHSNSYYMKTYSLILTHADYVDSLLDYYNEDTYQFLGFNRDNMLYSLTSHLPKGPQFVQDEYNYSDENNWFSQALLQQLDEVNIVIFSEFSIPAIENEVKYILDTEFTTEPDNPYTETAIPDEFECTIYYRKSVFAQGK